MKNEIITSCKLFFIVISIYRICIGAISYGLGKDIQSPLEKFGVGISTLNISPFPRAYTGLGFSDVILFQVTFFDYTKKILKFDHSAVSVLASSQLYQYDVYLHSVFWPAKAPGIMTHAKKSLHYGFCEGKTLARVFLIKKEIRAIKILRYSRITKEKISEMDVLCQQ